MDRGETPGTGALRSSRTEKRLTFSDTATRPQAMRGTAGDSVTSGIFRYLPMISRKRWYFSVRRPSSVNTAS